MNNNEIISKEVKGIIDNYVSVQMHKISRMTNNPFPPHISYPSHISVVPTPSYREMKKAIELIPEIIQCYLDGNNTLDESQRLYYEGLSRFYTNIRMMYQADFK